MLNKNNSKIIFIIIFLIGLFLRIIYLEKIPPGLYIDHVTKAYDAYSILKSGKNVYGEKFPLFFDTGLDRREPIFIYTISFFIFLFGLSKISVSLAAVFYGTMTILATYLFVKSTFGEKEALISSFLIAVSPWNFVLSRNVFRVISLPFFLVMGLYFWRISDFKNKKYIALSGIFFGLVLYTYTTSRLFLPLILISLFVIDFKKIIKRKKSIIVFILSFLITSLPFIYYFTLNYNELQKRFNSISIFNKEFIEKNKSLSNKDIILLYCETFLKNYLKHFSFNFLFLHGDSNHRHSVPNFGQLHIFEFPLLLIGIIICLIRKNNYYKFLIFWLIIYPIPSSLTNEGIPHALRSYNGFPVFEIISSLGFVFIIDEIYKRKMTFLILLIFIVIVFFCYKFFAYYFQRYSIETYYYYDKYLGEAIQYGIKLENNYDKIILDTDVMGQEYYVAFYKKLDPNLFRESKIKTTKFCLINECEQLENKKVLLITDKEKNVKNFNLINKLQIENNKTVFYFYEIYNFSYPIYPKEWLVCGPFDNNQDNGLYMDFINESATSFDNFLCTNWIKYYTTNKFVDFGNNEMKVYYAFTIFNSDKKSNVDLYYGSDDGIKIFINGNEIIDEHEHRTAQIFYRDKIIQLNQGNNTILVKVENNYGSCGFYFGFLEEKNSELSGSFILPK
jgi:4-amino-4-deoxy-L-arabinose transferase-like glycosyltransferase